MQADLVRLAYLLSGVAAGAIAVAAWRRRSTTSDAAAAVAVGSAGVAWWAACALVVSLPGPASLRWAALLGITPGIALVVAGFHVEARCVAEPGWRPTRPTALLAVPALLASAAAATNPWHRLFLTGWTPVPRIGWVSWGAGPLFWVHIAYSYLVVGVGLVALTRHRRSAPPLQRRQIDVMLLAAAVAAVGGALSVAPPLRGVLPDVTVICFCVTAAVRGYAILRLGHLDLVPVARGVVLDGLPDGVFVLDDAGRLVDVNAAGMRLVRALVPGPAGPVLGRDGADLFRSAFAAPFRSGEYRLTVDGAEAVYDVRVTPLLGTTGDAAGNVVVARDVSDAHGQRTALATANQLLRAQVETIERLRSDLAEQAVRDELTGLHNRRHLVVALDLAVAHSRLHGEDLVVVLLDIDRFKEVNDRFGHAVGDRVLVAVAGVLAGSVREHDTVARYGGEEFVVLLPGTDPDAALARVERWRQACAGAVVDSADGPAATTLSAGIAAVSQVGPDPAALLQAADLALYAAKADGRDRVVVTGSRNSPHTTGAPAATGH